MMSDMARATGRDASKYEAMQQKATDYIRATFTNTDGTFKNDILNTMQTPALFALRNHLFSGEAKTRLINRLRDKFHDNPDFEIVTVRGLGYKAVLKQH